MASLPRLRLPQGRGRFWFDPRFAVGLVLVIASLLGVTLLVSAAERTRPVYAATQTLAAGETVTEGDLAIAQVRLGRAERSYLSPGDLPSGGVVLTRTVQDGELLPAGAVADAASVDTSSVVVESAGRLPRSVAAGRLVDVWAAREGEGGVFGPPGVLVPAATVVRVLEDDGLVGDGTAESVEILVPRDRVARVLESIANGDAVSLVPAAPAAPAPAPPPAPSPGEGE
ncbi:flagella basal body P-ring formation protein FlgA [Microbacteriaceae bacterium 4G12]